jgi:hypothetical protein
LIVTVEPCTKKLAPATWTFAPVKQSWIRAPGRPAWSSLAAKNLAVVIDGNQIRKRSTDINCDSHGAFRTAINEFYAGNDSAFWLVLNDYRRARNVSKNVE